MPINNCRVCGRSFFPKPLLRYENMPKAAQFLPDAAALATETGVDLEVCQCSGCGLVQLSNEPVSYYREVVRSSAFSEEMRAFRKDQFQNFVSRFSLKNKKVIEIGCGRGEYLSLMRECGVDAYGIEDCAQSVKDCVKNGLNVSKGFAGDVLELENAPFDAFFILNFLEHLPDLNSVLRGISDNLGASGIGLVEVPNFDMILRNKLFSEFIPDHLFYFTKDTLSAALQSNGFEVIECREVWHDYIISAVVKKRIPLDLSHFHLQQERLRTEIGRYLAKFGDKKVAIWGAGHQALAVIALTGLSGKIKYVLDSAPFKQGKFTPATHIPIVSPETLATDPAEAVIIMAASYSDEVARLIRQRFSRDIRVAILRDSGLETDATP